jgi:uncharacterized membrane protein
MKIRNAEILSVCTMLVSIGLSISAFSRLPPQMAIHWGIDGVADGFAPRYIAAFLTPVLNLFIVALMLMARHIGPRKENMQRSAYANDVSLLGGSLTLLALNGMVLAVGMSIAIDIVRLAFVACGTLLIVVGNVMGKTRSNFFIGIRTPWTLSSEQVWDKVQRVGGRILLVEGLLCFLIASSGPVGPSMAIRMIATMVATYAGLVAYSMVLYSREVKAGGVASPGRK